MALLNILEHRNATQFFDFAEVLRRPFGAPFQSIFNAMHYLCLCTALFISFLCIFYFNFIFLYVSFYLFMYVLSRLFFVLFILYAFFIFYICSI